MPLRQHREHVVLRFGVFVPNLNSPIYSTRVLSRNSKLVVRLDAGNMDKRASGNRKIAKSGHWVAAEMVPFPRRWHGSIISAKLDVILP